MAVVLRRPRGFTLVELLVVIAIIGILVSLVMPAIQSSRESARVVQCQNNMKQMSTATKSYESNWNQMPSGGWGPTWVGMPPYLKEKQMGGWIYQLLPYAEEDQIAKLQTPDIKSANAQRAMKVIPWLYCPTRRTAEALPYSGPALLECNSVTLAGRTDYAGNVGNSSAAACEDGGKFPQTATGATTTTASTWIDFDNKVLNGAIVQRRGLISADFPDGRYRTYLYGEKAMARDLVDTGTADGDKAPALSGFGNATIRATNKMMVPDTNGLAQDCRFGSAHPGGANFVFADGTVRLQDFGIDPTVFSQLGSRKDSGPANEGDYVK